MTFSDTRIVNFINDNFVPAWESVSPVRTVTFELGEGRAMKGIISGEIALYFCTPQGQVFDILPALQSQAATLAALEEALTFYQEQTLPLSSQAIREFHRNRMQKIAGQHFDLNAANHLLPQKLLKSQEGARLRDQRINEAVDRATRDMRVMINSKTIEMPVFSTRRTTSDFVEGAPLPTPSLSTTPLVVIEPGGRDYYRWEVARRFLSASSWTSDSRLIIFDEDAPPPEPRLRPRTPEAWKEELFHYILKQPLNQGQDVHYDSDSLEAIRVIPD